MTVARAGLLFSDAQFMHRPLPTVAFSQLVAAALRVAKAKRGYAWSALFLRSRSAGDGSRRCAFFYGDPCALRPCRAISVRMELEFVLPSVSLDARKMSDATTSSTATEGLDSARGVLERETSR